MREINRRRAVARARCKLHVLALLQRGHAALRVGLVEENGAKVRQRRPEFALQDGVHGAEVLLEVLQASSRRHEAQRKRKAVCVRELRAAPVARRGPLLELHEQRVEEEGGDAEEVHEGAVAPLAELQRAMYVVDNDLTQVTMGQIEGDSATLSFNRPLAAEGGIPVRVRYQLGSGTLLRGFRGPGLPVGEQRVLQGVSSLRWTYYAPSLGWIDRWPPSPELKDKWPAAIAVDIALTPGNTVNGSLRRITVLPGQP